MLKISFSHGEQGWAGGLRCGESPGTPSRGSPARRRAMASAGRRRLRPRLMRRRPGRRRRRRARISALRGEVREVGRRCGTPRRRGAAASPSPPPPQLVRDYELSTRDNLWEGGGTGRDCHIGLLSLGQPRQLSLPLSGLEKLARRCRASTRRPVWWNPLFLFMISVMQRNICKMVATIERKM